MGQVGYYQASVITECQETVNEGPFTYRTSTHVDVRRRAYVNGPYTTVWSMSERFVSMSAKIALYKYSSFPFSFWALNNECT